MGQQSERAPKRQERRTRPAPRRRTREVDTYLTPFETSQHKVGWFTEAPGAVSGPAQLAELDEAPRRYGARAAEGITLPAYVIGEPVGDGERRDAKDRRQGLHTLRLDVDALVETLCSLVEQRSATREPC